MLLAFLPEAVVASCSCSFRYPLSAFSPNCPTWRSQSAPSERLHGCSFQLEGFSQAQSRFRPGQSLHRHGQRQQRAAKSNQLHAGCNSRIKYQKVCPIHGEVSSDQIVSGYEYSKDQYVVIDTAELEKLRTEDSKALTVQEFIPSDALDPMYFSGTTYYLVPDGPVGQRPYAVIHQGMVEQDRYAIAQVVWHGKEQVVLIRPVDGLLTMTGLSYEHQVTKPSAFEDETPKAEIAPDEMKLAKTLIAATTKKKFDFSVYKDVYTEKLTQLIEAKVAGKEIVAAQPHEHAQIINLMDALKQSVEKLQVAGDEEKPPQKMAPSKKGRSESARKKKSS